MAAKALRIKILRCNNCSQTTSAPSYSNSMQHKMMFKHSAGRYLNASFHVRLSLIDLDEKWSCYGSKIESS